MMTYVDFLNRTDARYPESSDFRDGAKAEGHWYEPSKDFRIKKVEQICGQSGVYLVVSDFETGEVIHDDRPWQMKV